MPIKDNSQEVTSRKHPVPQNVMDVEFKVVGDLTVRQILYLFVGGAVAFVLVRSTALPDFWRWVFVIFVVLLSLGLAFVPIQERALDKWVVIFINAMLSPTQMKWQKIPTPPVYFLSDYAQIIKNEIITLTPVKSRGKLDEYLSNLNDSTNDLDKEETQRITEIGQHMSTTTPNSQVFAQLKTEIVANPLPQNPPSILDTLSKSDLEPLTTDLVSTSIVQDLPNSNSPKNKFTNDIKTPLDTSDTQNQDSQVQKSQSGDTKPPTLDKTKTTSIEQIVKDEMASKIELLQGFSSPNKLSTNINTKANSAKSSDDSAKNPATSKKHKLPDSEQPKKPMSSNKANTIDRPITLQSNESNTIAMGKIDLRHIAKLPPIIVAEDIKDLKEQEETLEKKVSELLEVAKRARAEYQIKTGTTPKDPIEDQPLDPKTKQRFDELKKEQSKIVNQISKSKAQVNLLDKDAKGREKLETQIKTLTAQNQLLETRLRQIHAKLSGQPDLETVQPTIQNATNNTDELYQDISKSQTDNTQAQEPNKITGVVKSQTGDLIDSAVVLIKDSDGNVMRALKTNPLGQFTSESPVTNGTYFVEIIKGGHKFDIMKVEAKGNVMSPLYFVAK